MATKQITFQGKPLTLVGRNIKVGATAPQFKVTTHDLKEVDLAHFQGQIKIITSFPSLDTPVCDLQVKEFNNKASELSEDIVIIGISKDLPFAQQKFCSNYKIKNISILSDYKNSFFGLNYGLLIKEDNLLARAVLIIDKNDILKYIQVVPELATPPNYAETFNKLQEILNSTEFPVEQIIRDKCLVCESKNLKPLSVEKAIKLATEVPNWQLIENKKIIRKFNFKDSIDAKYFLDLLTLIAEEEGHHPSFKLDYNNLQVSLTTHSVCGLTDNDFIMAKIIDDLL